MRYTFFGILLLLSSANGYAQQFLNGKVRKKGTTEVLMSVSIQNITRHQFNLSDEGGNFKIEAQEGDLLIFSSVGYQADTLLVTAPMFVGQYQVFLEPRAVALPTVRVGGQSNYQLDSMERRKDYDWVYDHKGVRLVDKNKQGDGIGASLNLPIYTSAERQRERLKKRLIQEEEDFYIDSRFGREYVSRLTHLQGDSLQMFMFRYRPTYQFCRMANNTDILLWINDSIKLFRKKS